MPSLDVSDAFAPEMMDDLQAERRTQTIDRFGRASEVVVINDFAGVVTATSPDDLVRVPEEELQNKAISVTTQYRLQGPTAGFAGDIVHWHGSRFLVRDIEDYSGYGEGFVHAICVAIDATDQPPQAAPV